MKKLGIAILIGIVVVVLSGVATAGTGRLIPVVEQAKEKAKADISPVIEKTDEGFALSPPGLEKIVFIHYKKGFAKPSGGTKGAACYGFLSKGAKLKSVGDLTIHPDLDVSTILASANEWDSYTSATLFGTSTIDSTANWDSDAPDGRNEFSYGNYLQEGVIAVTIVWGYFSGHPSTREIVEFDVMFDTGYEWGDATVDKTKMDLQNIATHELGHGVGLADVYQTSCSEVTMYGYSNYEEVKKRDLAGQDITGLRTLYGQ